MADRGDSGGAAAVRFPPRAVRSTTVLSQRRSERTLASALTSFRRQPLRPLPATSFSGWSVCCVNTQPWGFMFTHEPEVCAFYILVPIWWLGTPAPVAPERWKYRWKWDLFVQKEQREPLGAHSTVPPFLRNLLLGTVDSLLTSQAGGARSPDPPRLGSAEAWHKGCWSSPSPPARVSCEPCAALRWLCSSSSFRF